MWDYRTVILRQVCLLCRGKLDPISSCIVDWCSAKQGVNGGYARVIYFIGCSQAYRAGYIILSSHACAGLCTAKFSSTASALKEGGSLLLRAWQLLWGWVRAFAALLSYFGFLLSVSRWWSSKRRGFHRHLRLLNANKGPFRVNRRPWEDLGEGLL